MIYLGSRASQVGKILVKRREGAINDFVLISNHKVVAVRLVIKTCPNATLFAR